MERDTFGAIVTDKTNPERKEIMIVRTGSETNARSLIHRCAEKQGWLADGHVFLVSECPAPEVPPDDKATMLRTPVADQVKDDLPKPPDKL